MNHSNPLVSIVIPVYNVQDYLEQCLSSVVQQTYRHLEIICVIDGSQDNSEKIARHIAAVDSRCRIITQANQGLSVARNTGVDASNGDWVFFLDSDDWLTENAIEKLLAAALHSQRSTCSGAAMEYWEETGTIKPYKNPKKRRLGPLNLHQQDFLTLEPMAWNKLYRRDLVINTPFTPGLVHEDLDFYWRIFSEYPEIVAIPEVVVFYRRRSGTMSQQKSYCEDYQDNYIRILDNAFTAIQKHRQLRYYFFRQALKYLKYLKAKKAPNTRYERHIRKRYGVRDTVGFRIGLKLRRLIGTV